MLALLSLTTALVVQSEAPAALPALLKLRGGMMLDTKSLNLAGALYHGSFGLALYADGNAFADSGMSPVKYTADAEGPVGEFTARAFGAMMLAMGSLALFEDALVCEGVTKMFAIAMGLFSPILVKNIQAGEPSFKPTWKLQAFLHLPFTALMLFKAFGKKD